ncbi:hypothetical protein GALMADRAFT_143270 [Galerina marginata CBS 339.88]|uniref:Uncharacterized protein n=1 Tax=Galerina marginata (strain CBS 339.88) TaxID=685588 RepID=A0A067SR26_GALM3|nr:hypothetical protein GALMADRAFT_143270 [Galerina marginata CBS 339.88]
MASAPRQVPSLADSPGPATLRAFKKFGMSHLRRFPFRSFNTPSYTTASGVLQHWSPQQRPLRSSRCCTPFKTGNRGIGWTGACINPDASPPPKSSAVPGSGSPAGTDRFSLS